MATLTVNLILRSFTPDDDPPHMVASYTGAVGDPLAGETAQTDYDGVGSHAGAQCFVFIGFEFFPAVGMVWNTPPSATLNITSGKLHGIARVQANAVTYDDPGIIGPVVVGDGELFDFFNAVSYGIGTVEQAFFLFNTATVDLDYDVTVTDCNPGTGASGGGEPVTITGTNFVDGATVEFGAGNFATSVVVVSATSITCDTPAGVGVVDVIVTNGVDQGSASGTLTSGFNYDSTISAPTVDAGPSQFVLGPPTRTLSTDATVTPGHNNASVTYLWEFISGPYTPTFSDPTQLNIDVDFDHYDPGAFIFKLTATGITADAIELSSSDTVTFTIKVTVPPLVSTGTVVIEYPDCATITPVVTDDGWGGAVGLPTYEFVSGPTVPTVTVSGFFDPEIFDPNIFDCYSVRICGFLDETAVYVFRVTFTREDTLTTSVLWRIVVYSDQETIDDGNTADVTILVNGVEFNTIINSLNISKNLNNQPTCNFKVEQGLRIEPGNEVIITRGSVRMFGGLCLSQQLTFDDETIPFYQPSLVGFAWHLHRTRVTKTYTDMSISDIAADLLTFSPTAIAGTRIQASLEAATVAFSGQYIDECLTQLSKLSSPPCHWFVDDFKVLHFAKVEEDGDPLPLSLFHPFFRTLNLTEDLGSVANRVIVNYNAVSTVPAEVDRDIEVPSLEGYNPAGGTTTIGPNQITYTGTARRQITHYRDVFPNIAVTSETVSGGALVDYFYEYFLTYQTPYGETAPVWGSGISGAPDINTDLGWRLKLLQQLAAVDPLTTNPKDISAINVYRGSSGSGRFVGTIDPRGGPGFLDYLDESELPFVIIVDSDFGNGEKVGFFLTGCNGTTTTNVVSQVTEDDTDAQAALALRLGGTDTGVIELVIDGGDITEDVARQLARAYLDRVSGMRKIASWLARDDKSIPGQMMTLFFPEYNFEADLTIQSTSLNGFEHRVAHEYSVQAAPDTVTVQDLLRHTMEKQLA